MAHWFKAISNSLIFWEKNDMSIMDGPNFMFDMIYSHITIWTFNHQKNDMLLSRIKACRQCRRSGNQTWQWTIVRLFQCVFPLKGQCCSWISQLAVPDVQRATIPSPYVYIYNETPPRNHGLIVDILWFIYVWDHLEDGV
jgi:hypothetical protein